MNSQFVKPNIFIVMAFIHFLYSCYWPIKGAMRLLNRYNVLIIQSCVLLDYKSSLFGYKINKNTYLALINIIGCRTSKYMLELAINLVQFFGK